MEKVSTVDDNGIEFYTRLKGSLKIARKIAQDLKSAYEEVSREQLDIDIKGGDRILIHKNDNVVFVGDVDTNGG